MQLTESEHPVGERPRFDSWQRDTNGTEQEKQLVKDFGPWSLKQQSRRLSNIWKRYKKNPSVHSWSEAEKSWFEDSRNNEERKVFFTKEKKFPDFLKLSSTWISWSVFMCECVCVCVCFCKASVPLRKTSDSCNLHLPLDPYVLQSVGLAVPVTETLRLYFHFSKKAFFRKM